MRRDGDEGEETLGFVEATRRWWKCRVTVLHRVGIAGGGADIEGIQSHQGSRIVILEKKLPP